MTDRRRRSEKLVNDIRSALERGVSRDRIHAALVGRNVPPDKATLLLNAIASQTRSMAVEPLMIAPEPAPAAMPRRRRGRAPFFLAFAVVLLAVGFAGVFSTEPREDPATVDTSSQVARLDAEVVSAREHIAHLETRLEPRKVDAEQIEWLRARVARGPESFDTDDDYRDMVAIYERRRARWNRTLPEYQVVARALRMMVDIHNAKVDSLTALAAHAPAVDGRQVASPVRYARITTTASTM